MQSAFLEHAYEQPSVSICQYSEGQEVCLEQKVVADVLSEYEAIAKAQDLISSGGGVMSRGGGVEG